VMWVRVSWVFITMQIVPSEQVGGIGPHFNAGKECTSYRVSPLISTLSNNDRRIFSFSSWLLYPTDRYCTLRIGELASVTAQIRTIVGVVKQIRERL
jgi:hypothetical protein